MPFFIPSALIATGVATGGGGFVLGGKVFYDWKRSSERWQEANLRIEWRRAITENKRESSNRKLKTLGTKRKKAHIDVVIRMRDFLRRYDYQVRENDRFSAESIDSTTIPVSELKSLDARAVTLVGGTFGVVAAGAGAVGAGISIRACITTAVGNMGAASTGAPIRELYGAARKNAIQAWLGGGSIASGGGGMAWGGIALTSVTIGSTLLVGGFIVKEFSAEALTQARRREAEAAAAIAKFDEFDTWLEGVNAQADEISDLLAKLSPLATSALDLLESEPFDPQAHAPRFQQAMALVIAVRDIVTTPIIGVDSAVTG